MFGLPMFFFPVQLPFEVYQEGAEREVVMPGFDLPYGWDYPLQEKRMSWARARGTAF